MPETQIKKVILKDSSNASINLYPKTDASVITFRCDSTSLSDVLPVSLTQANPLITVNEVPQKVLETSNAAGLFSAKYFNINSAGSSYVLDEAFQGTPGLLINSSSPGHYSIQNFTPPAFIANSTNYLKIPKYFYNSATGVNNSGFFTLDTISTSAFNNKLGNIKLVKIPETITTIGQYAFANNSNLSTVFIPDSVVTIDTHAFNNCSNLTIFTEHASKPNGWDANWNPNNQPVVWNSKLVDPTEYLYISAPQSETQINTNNVVLMQYDNNQ